MGLLDKTSETEHTALLPQPDQTVVYAFEPELNEQEEAIDVALSESMVIAHKKLNLAKLTVISFAFFTSLSIAISPRFILTLTKICNDLYPMENMNAPGSIFADSNCDGIRAQELASKISSSTLFLQSLISIIVAGKVGEFADLKGRKLGLLLVISFMILSRIGTAVFLTPLVQFNAVVFIAMNLAESITGGMKGVLGIMRAYVVDIVDPNERVTALGIITGTLFSGLAIGPLISSFVNKAVKGNDMIAIYMELSGMTLTTLGLILFVPESHIARPKRAPVTGRFNPLKIFSSLRLFRIHKSPTTTEPRRKQLTVIMLIIIDVLTYSSVITISLTLILYGTLKFNWTSVDIGYLLTVVGTCRAFQSFVLIPAYQEYLKRKGYSSPENDKHDSRLSKADVFTIRLATLFTLAEVFIILTATNTPTILMSMVVGSFATINIPIIHTSIVKLCSENVIGSNGDSDSKVGELFGAINLIENISIMVLTTLVIMVYSKTVDKHSKVCFLMLFAIIAIAVVLTMLLAAEPNKIDVDEDDEEDA